MKFPNFFIIGAPKCGTTSLHAYLSDHPKIFMSNPKELAYFNTDQYNPLRPRSQAEYLSYFKGASSNHLRAGEASVAYLHSREAVSNILSFNKDALFIIMVRNNIDMARSLHGHFYYSAGIEDVEDFETAWRLQDVRRSGRYNGARTQDISELLYGEQCKLGADIQRVLQQVPRNQVHVIVFDDMLRDPGTVYRSTLAFLEVPDDGRTDFDPRNVGGKPKFVFMQKVLHCAQAIRYQLPVRYLGLGLIEKLDQMNRSSDRTPALSSQFRAELADYFREDIELLSRLVGRDLSGWLEPGGRLEATKSTDG